MTTRNELIKQLRAADEQTVGQALADAYMVNMDDIPSADLLEFFNKMVDALVGSDEG